MKKKETLDLDSMLDSMLDIDFNISMKQIFGICPIEILASIVLKDKYKLKTKN